MPKIAHIHIAMFSSAIHLAALTETAALHELVLVSAHHLVVGGRLEVLRQALAPRRLVALIVADDLPPVERTFIDELLNDGVIPLIVPLGGGPTAALMSWLESNERSVAGAGHRRDGRGMRRPPHRCRSRWTPGGDDADEPPDPHRTSAQVATSALYADCAAEVRSNLGGAVEGAGTTVSVSGRSCPC